MLRAIRSPLLSMLAELLTDDFTPAQLGLVVQSLMRSTDTAHVAEMFSMLCGVIGLRDDEAAVVATEAAMPPDVFYRLAQHPEERVRTLTYVLPPCRPLRSPSARSVAHACHLHPLLFPAG